MIRSSRSKWASKWSPLALGLVLGVGFAPSTRAEDKPKDPKANDLKNQIFLTPEAAGPDFKVQGEYVGNVGSEKLGAQVIALGGGSFRAVFEPGGLPGEGWDGKTKSPVEGKTEGGTTTFGSATSNKSAYTATIPASGETLAGKTDKGESFELKKVLRKSPTQGLKPAEGAVVLFDGTDASHFPGGHLDDRHLLASGPTSKDKFADYTLHAEFLLPFKPYARGQERANSGVYQQNKYEIQVLDSFGLKGENNECGAVYSKTAPSVNMCYPPLQWQTYDIDFAGARYKDGKKVSNAVVTSRHNGVLVLDKVEIAGPTGGGQKEDPTQDVQSGPIQLQGHGNPVFYQNVWVVEKK